MAKFTFVLQYDDEREAVDYNSDMTDHQSLVCLTAVINELATKHAMELTLNRNTEILREDVLEEYQEWLKK